MSIVHRARPEIRALHAYDAAAQVDDTVRLNANESPHSTASDRFRRPLNRYPEVRPQRLQAAMAARFGCGYEQLLVTRGSSEAIDLLIRTFCRAGRDNIVTPTPSFSMYRHYAEVQDAAVIEVPTLAERDFMIDTAALLAACGDATRLVFVCSPNNPTGTPLARRDLSGLIESLHDRAAVVVDEAYVEFGRQPSVIEWLDRYPNLVVLRTLSKALGFAGVRCGAVAANADVIRLLNAVQAPYALATPVVECVEDILQSERLAAAEALVAEIVAERERLQQRLADYAFVDKVWPSEANFLLIRAADSEALTARCRSRGILLRDFGKELPNCLRITVGSREENDQLLRVFDTLQGISDGD